MTGIRYARKLLAKTLLPILVVGGAFCGLLLIAMVPQAISPLLLLIVAVGVGAGGYHWYVRRFDSDPES